MHSSSFDRGKGSYSSGKFTLECPGVINLLHEIGQGETLLIKDFKADAASAGKSIGREIKTGLIDLVG